MDVSTDELKNIDLFENMSEEALGVITDGSDLLQLSADQMLFEQGDDSSGTFFVILDGEIGIRKDMRTEKSTVDTLDSGNFFGELALFTGDERKADAVALTSTKIIEIPKSVLKLLKDEHPSSLNELYEAMFDQLAVRFNSLAQKAEKSQFWL